MNNVEYCELIERICHSGKGFEALKDITAYLTRQNGFMLERMRLDYAKQRAALKLIDGGGTMHGVKAILEDE